MGKFKIQVIQREGHISPTKPTLELFLLWLNEIKKHRYFNKFNCYLFGGFLSWPEKTMDVDILITKKVGENVKLYHLENLMSYMWDYAYDELGFRIDPMYYRIYKWIANYPRDRKFLKLNEKKTLTIFLSRNKLVGSKRYGKLSCFYNSSWDCRSKDVKGKIKPGSFQTGDIVHKWVDKKLPLTKLVDLNNIISYYENNDSINMNDFLKKFQVYSGY